LPLPYSLFTIHPISTPSPAPTTLKT
jgi:hypothetical protein